MKIWYGVKAVLHFLGKYWWIFVSLLLGVFVTLYFAFRKKEKPKGKTILEGVSEKIKKQEVSTKIELAKVKANTDKKVKQLEKIKKIEDNKSRVNALADFLTSEFSD